MPYPETAEGFMINDQKNWTDFEKKEVRNGPRQPVGSMFLTA